MEVCEMIAKHPFSDSQVSYLADCTCGYPASTITVGRARLLYQILHDSGMDELKEVQRGW